MAYLVVFAIGVAAAVVGEDAALAVEDVAGVALASLHAVVAAVALEADGGASGLAQRHAALVVAVGGTADGCNITKGTKQTLMSSLDKTDTGDIIPAATVPAEVVNMDCAAQRGTQSSQPLSLHPTPLTNCLLQAEQHFSITPHCL